MDEIKIIENGIDYFTRELLDEIFKPPGSTTSLSGNTSQTFTKDLTDEIDSI